VVVFCRWIVSGRQVHPLSEAKEYHPLLFGCDSATIQALLKNLEAWRRVKQESESQTVGIGHSQDTASAPPPIVIDTKKQSEGETVEIQSFTPKRQAHFDKLEVATERDEEKEAKENDEFEKRGGWDMYWNLVNGLKQLVQDDKAHDTCHGTCHEF